MPTTSGHHDHNHTHAASRDDADLHDPVCGMAVTSSSKFAETYQGQTYRFCSLKCQEKFRADPERYSGHVVRNESGSTTPESAVQTGAALNRGRNRARDGGSLVTTSSWFGSKLDRVRSGDTRDLMGRMAFFCKGTGLG